MRVSLTFGYGLVLHRDVSALYPLWFDKHGEPIWAIGPVAVQDRLMSDIRAGVVLFDGVSIINMGQVATAMVTE